MGNTSQSHSVCTHYRSQELWFPLSLCKRKRKREPSAATGQGRGSVPCTPAPAPQCSQPEKPAACEHWAQQAHGASHHPPGPGHLARPRHRLTPTRNTDTTPAPSSPRGPNTVFYVKLSTNTVEDIDQSTSPLSCLFSLSMFLRGRDGGEKEGPFFKTFTQDQGTAP